MRIVSLLPSSTEMVCLLGLERNLVGVSHECDFPPSVRSLPKVTRPLVPQSPSSRTIDLAVRERVEAGDPLYQLDHAVISRLQPDLVVTQSLCQVCAVAEDDVRRASARLASTPRLVSLAPVTLSQVLDAMVQLGHATATLREAEQVVGRLRSRVRAVEMRSADIGQRKRVALVEWVDPPFAAGHWNPELVAIAGGVDVLGRVGLPSRSLDWQEVAAAEPDLVFVAACGLGLDRTLAELSDLARSGAIPRALQETSRWLVADGSQYFNRPGPRLVDSLEILAHALNPELHPLPSHLEPANRFALPRDDSIPAGL